MCEDLLSVLSLDIGGIWARSGEHVCGVDTAPAGENIPHSDGAFLGKSRNA